MWSTNVLPAGANTFRIFLDPDYPDEFRGMVRVAGMAAPLEFSTLSRLIVLLDDLMDRQNPESQVPTLHKDQASFEIEILFRQNYSWQGRLRLPKIGREAVFRSVLELLLIIETYFEG